MIEKQQLQRINSVLDDASNIVGDLLAEIEILDAEIVVLKEKIASLTHDIENHSCRSERGYYT